MKGIANFWNTNLNTASPSAVWEAFKSTLSGTFMSITGNLQKNSLSM